MSRSNLIKWFFEHCGTPDPKIEKTIIPLYSSTVILSPEFIPNVWDAWSRGPRKITPTSPPYTKEDFDSMIREQFYLSNYINFESMYSYFVNMAYDSIHIKTTAHKEFSNNPIVLDSSKYSIFVIHGEKLTEETCNSLNRICCSLNPALTQHMPSFMRDKIYHCSIGENENHSRDIVIKNAFPINNISAFFDFENVREGMVKLYGESNYTSWSKHTDAPPFESWITYD